MRRSLPIALLVLLAATASAQSPPSEARIKADAREHVAPGATDVTIRGDGERQLNRGVYQYARAITIHVDQHHQPRGPGSLLGDLGGPGTGWQI